MGWLLACVVAGCSVGGLVAAPVSPYLIRVFQADDGLPNNDVTALAQTRDGYLWIGMSHGLARFDGVRFVNFAPDNTPALLGGGAVAQLMAGDDGALWIGMAGGGLLSCRGGVFQAEWKAGPGEAGISRLLWQSGDEVIFALHSRHLLRGGRTPAGTWRWETVSTPGSTGYWLCNADASGQVFSLADDSKLSRWAEGKFSPLGDDLGLAGRRIAVMERDVHGQIWVGTEKELARWNGARFTRMTPTNGEPELDVEGIRGAGDGTLWVAANGRTRRLRGREWVADAGEWTGRQEPMFDAVGYFADRQGGQWSYSGNGLIHLRPDGGMNRIKEGDGLPNARPACWFQDREDNVWVGFNRGGLARLSPRRFEMVGAAQGLSDPVVLSVCASGNGELWFGTYGGGVNCWRDGMMTAFDVGRDRSRGVVNCVMAGEGDRVYAAVDNVGLLVREAGAWKTLFESQHACSPVHALWRDRKGGVWLGGSEGLAVWAGGELKRYGTKEGFRGGVVQAGAEDASGAIWVGTQGGVLWRFKDERFTEFQPPGPLGGQPVWSVLPDADGTVWVGTFRGGLLRWKDGKFSRCTTREGLPHDVICQVLDDGLGQLWLSSHGGIIRVPKSELDALAEGRTHTVRCNAYGRAEGLATIECSGGFQPAGWRSGDGRLWFATARGVASVQPSQISNNPLPPPVVIEEVAVDDVIIPLRTPALDAAGDAGAPALRVSPGRHQIEFRFTGLSFTAPEGVRFQYRLENLDHGWTDGGTRRTVRYAYLPPGHYVFRVRACNSDGVWNERGAAVAITVVPFFWQTGAFIWATAAAAVLGTGFSIWRWERSRARRKLEVLERRHALERERTRIAQDLHDDLGTSLTEIGLIGALAQRPTASVGQVHGHLDDIGQKVRSMVTALDEIVWAVSPRNDIVASVASYFCLFAERFLHIAAIRCRFEVASNLPGHPINSEERHHLFLAFREALHNVVRHSGAAEVRLTIAVTDGALVVAVQDNGRGLDHEAPEIGADGLENMRQRLAGLGGSCEITGAVNEGTTVRFRLPLR